MLLYERDKEPAIGLEGGESAKKNDHFDGNLKHADRPYDIGCEVLGDDFEQANKRLEPRTYGKCLQIFAYGAGGSRKALDGDTSLNKM